MSNSGCLNANPVCNILKLNTNGFQSLNLTTSELIEVIEKKFSIDDLSIKEQFLKTGLDCQVLQLGSKQWKQGEIRFKLLVEFCPDELEDES